MIDREAAIAAIQSATFFWKITEPKPPTEDEIIAALSPQWQDIATAPKDGTEIWVWRKEGGRVTVYWGKPLHICSGDYCDSDWHNIKNPNWVCSNFGQFVGGKHNPFTLWQPLPEAPAQ